MVILGIYTALYDYEPQGDNELSIQEGELLYVLEKSDVDDWWKAKKRAAADEEEEPVGLIPNNYVEEVSSIFSNTPEFMRRYLDLAWAMFPVLGQPLQYHCLGHLTQGLQSRPPDLGNC